MTARQQIARLLPLVLLVVLVIAGLRGVVPAPRWNGPLKADGVAIGIALEVVFGALLLVVRARDATARRAAPSRPYNATAPDIEPPRALRLTLKYVLSLGMLGIAVVLIANLHLHLFGGAPGSAPNQKDQAQPEAAVAAGRRRQPEHPARPDPVRAADRRDRGRRRGQHLVVDPAAPPGAAAVIEDVTADELRAAVDEGRAALAGIDDARAAIIACYVAMERRLAERGTARGAADTPDELLARAVAAGVVRGGAAGRLTALFYEARFSTHPLDAGQRDAASAALDDLAAELAAKPEAPPASSQASGQAKRSGPARAGRWLGMNWRPALPELVIAAITVAAAILAAAAVAGWPGVVVVAAATTVIALLLLRGIIPRSAAQTLRQTKDKQRARSISGYAQRRFIVATSLTSRPMYESDLRPVLEHILAARLAENHSVNLYTEPDKARKAFCQTRRDESLWRWIDPAETLDADERARQRHGIPGRTLSRLITRLEQL